MGRPDTLFDKVWNDHVVVRETAETPAVLYIDLHLIHEVTTPQAFSLLREKGLQVRRRDLTLATMDHSTPTRPRSAGGPLEVLDGEAAVVEVEVVPEAADYFRLFDLWVNSLVRAAAEAGGAGR